MNKKLKSILTYLFWALLSVALLYFSFRGVDWKDFGTALRSCRWGYVVLSMLLGALVLFIRGLRWRMQLLPVDPSTSRLTCWNAYNICMIVNLVLPRVGEVVRCGYVSRDSGRDSEGNRLATVDKVLGTVIMDRLWDVVSVGVVFIAMLAVMWDRFGAFFTETVFDGVAGKASHLWWILVLAVLVLVGFILLCRKFQDRGAFWKKSWGYIKGTGDGLSSCLHMKNGWLFIVYTAIIWGIYWLMSATIMWSLQGIDPAGLSPELAAALEKVNQLGMADALFLMFAGSMSSLVPVPGGFGAFHTVVAGALASIYGIPFSVGLIFATLSHESQVLTDAFCGAGSYLYETFFRRGK